MAEVEKADIEKLHQRLDKITETCLTPIKVSVGKLEQRFDDLIIPSQPCKELTEHINDHKENRNMWKKPVINHVIDLVKIGAILVIGYVFGKKL